MSNETVMREYSGHIYVTLSSDVTFMWLVFIIYSSFYGGFSVTETSVES
jgi:hypothetical protein